MILATNVSGRLLKLDLHQLWNAVTSVSIYGLISFNIRVLARSVDLRGLLVHSEELSYRLMEEKRKREIQIGAAASADLALDWRSPRIPRLKFVRSSFS